MKKALDLSNRIGWIDLLEVIAIFFVIFYHSSIMSVDIMGVKLRRALHGEYHIFSHAMQRTL